ncbi:MAG: hypothetical protein JWQ74_1216 [Marmoricola sp.]|nr:hypothetical protein [Marmoricola sp.]
MAKKNPKNLERREMVEKMRKDQARKERTRSLAILGVCVLIVAALLGTAAFKAVQSDKDAKKIRATAISKLGTAKAEAGCDPEITKTAEGSGQHKTIGVPLSYPESPPAFGPHWANYLEGNEIRSFYTPEDRPEKERMVHSLEHGHTIVWYDETIKAGSAEYQQLQDIASKFSATSKYMTAPWFAADGGSFPAGKHVAMTHWTGPDNQKGVWEYCAKPSGEAINEFTQQYPASNSPEPAAP